MHRASQLLCIAGLGASRRLLQKQRAGTQSQRNVLRHRGRVRLAWLGLRRQALLQIAVPRIQMVHPAFHREAPASQLVSHKRRRPQIVAHLDHRRRPPAPLRLRPIQQPRRQVVVPIGKDRRRHRHRVPHDPACRVPPAVDLRFYSFNYDAASTLGRLHPTQLSI